MPAPPPASPAGDDLTATSRTIATTPQWTPSDDPRIFAALRRIAARRAAAERAVAAVGDVPPSAPPRLGRYDFARLDRRLGAGGMGQVWLAWDETLQVERAVKLPSERFAQDPRWREEMLREARVLAQLTHPGAARFYEFVADGDRCGLVMEFVRGRTLRDVLGQDGAPAVPEALRICHAVAEAIEAAHRHPMRIAHCDLKPANVMIADDGAVKVLDWGIAQRDLRPEDDEAEAAGTPGYLAPEVVLGSARSGRAADCFALGALLFETLAGSRAFPGRTADDRLRQTLYGEPEWARLPTATPAHVRILLRRLLEKSPLLRLQDVGEAVAALAEHDDLALRSPAVANNLPVPVSTFVGRTRELAELRSRIGASRAVVVLGLGGIGKTALALHEAACLADDPLVGAFRDGFWLARLGSLEEPSLLAESIARAVPGCVGVGAPAGARGEPGAPAEGGEALRLADCLADRSLLLLLDGCEHLAGPVSRLCRTLLERCPGVRIVATSRVPLEIPGASQLRLGPLSLAPGAAGGVSDAVRLFVESAQRVLHDFEPSGREQEAIRQIVARLDGIPLAIEIAAAWLGRCDLGDLLRALEERSGLLPRAADRADGGSARDDSLLESMVEGSVAALRPAARALLARLTVFGGGWTMSAAEEVCVDPEDGRLVKAEVPALLGELVDRSLVEFERVEESRRYRMLRPVLSVARRSLEPGPEGARSVELVRLERRHRRWCSAFVEALLGEAALPDPGGGRAGRLLHEWPNLRKAFASALAEGALDEAAALALRLHRPLYSGGLHREGAAIVERLVELRAEVDDRPGERSPERALLHAQLSNAAAVLRWHAGELDRADAHLLGADESLRGMVALAADGPDDTTGAATATRRRAELGRVGVRINRGLVAKDRPDVDAALGHFAEARRLAVSLGHQAGVVQADVNAAVLLQEIGQASKAEALLAPWQAVLANAPELAEFHAEALAVRGLARLERGELDSAGDDLGRALAWARRLDTVAKLPLRLWWIASLADAQGRHGEGAVLRFGAQRLARSLGVHEPHLRRADDDGTFDRLRRTLGTSAFAGARRESERLGVTELCELAGRVTDGESAPPESARPESAPWGPR